MQDKKSYQNLFSLKTAVAQAYSSLNVMGKNQEFFTSIHIPFFPPFETIYIHFLMNFSGWVSVKMMILLLKKFRKGCKQLWKTVQKLTRKLCSEVIQLQSSFTFLFSFHGENHNDLPSYQRSEKGIKNVEVSTTGFFFQLYLFFFKKKI